MDFSFDNLNHNPLRTCPTSKLAQHSLSTPRPSSRKALILYRPSLMKRCRTFLGEAKINCRTIFLNLLRRMPPKYQLFNSEVCFGSTLFPHNGHPLVGRHRLQAGIFMPTSSELKLDRNYAECSRKWMVAKVSVTAPRTLRP